MPRNEYEVGLAPIEQLWLQTWTLLTDTYMGHAVTKTNKANIGITKDSGSIHYSPTCFIPTVKRSQRRSHFSK